MTIRMPEETSLAGQRALVQLTEHQDLIPAVDSVGAVTCTALPTTAGAPYGSVPVAVIAKPPTSANDAFRAQRRPSVTGSAESAACHRVLRYVASSPILVGSDARTAELMEDDTHP
ncbi:hypothetical protein MARA_15220 [Mycolicibacterium arabiense]|uniref:Uncharacterized protein n=1 Tax=Mycolicibacterium arabiense TaxID=1286181 RepID=A0A7I7RTX6_9MYCO|nr:hypothetical protein MARA_15220 [Mycolicibacterium arabiense]